MSDASEVIGAMKELVVENSSGEGVDVVNVYASLIETLKTDPTITIEIWELMKMGIKNGADIACNLIDEEIAHLREENSA